MEEKIKTRVGLFKEKGQMLDGHVGSRIALCVERVLLTSSFLSVNALLYGSVHS